MLFSQIIPPSPSPIDPKIWYASRMCMSSLRRGHANLLCIIPILVYVLPKRAQIAQVLIDGWGKKKGELVYNLGRQEHPVTLPWACTPRGVSTRPKGSAPGCTPQPVTWGPCASSDGPEGAKPRGQEATCRVSLHARCSFLTGAGRA